MSQLMPPYPLIRDRLAQGRVIPFLGSGASLAGRAEGEEWGAYLPTATELAKFLAQRTEFPPGEPLDLAKVAQYYDIVGGRGPLHEELRGIFNRDFPLTTLHTFLAETATPLLIVTTNYDDLIERAFSARKLPYHVVIHTTERTRGDRLLWWSDSETEPKEVIPNKLDLDLQATTIIYKIHGAVDRREPERDQYVITEDDYIDFLARMTKNRAIPAIFAEAFQNRHFLFLGYGLSDWNLRVVLNRIERDLRRPKGIRSWAIQYLPSALEQRFWQERGVEVYDMKIDDFLGELASR